MALIAGVGEGTFAILVACAIALVVCMAVAYVMPHRAPLIAVASLALPLIVFGFFAGAPRKGELDDIAIDTLYPLRVTVIILLGIGVVLSVLASTVLPVFIAPKYHVPRMICRRKVLKAHHPTWVQ